jgi:hypothetical protein
MPFCVFQTLDSNPDKARALLLLPATADSFHCSISKWDRQGYSFLSGGRTALPGGVSTLLRTFLLPYTCSQPFA